MNPLPVDRETFSRFVEIGVKALIVLVLFSWSFSIISPFLGLLVWSGIIAIALFPVHRKLTAALGGRNKSSATILGLSGALLILVPVALLASQSVDAVDALSAQWQEGTLQVPEPSENVKGWPLIGEQAYELWHAASDDIEEFVEHFEPQLKAWGEKLVNFAASVGKGALFFVASFVIAAIFMANAQSQQSFFVQLEQRITGAESGPYMRMTIATIRSVAQGVIGTAVIQALLAGAGMLVMDIPLAGLWTLGLMILSILQLPSLILLGPIMAWAFSAHEATPATIFAIWCVLVGLSDNVLRPILMGRGLSVPMLVIMLGAIGGMLTMGIVGLFIGSVVLAISYELFVAWMRSNREIASESDASGAENSAG